MKIGGCVSILHADVWVTGAVVLADDQIAGDRGSAGACLAVQVATDEMKSSAVDRARCEIHGGSGEEALNRVLQGPADDVQGGDVCPAGSPEARVVDAGDGDRRARI